LTLGVCAGPVGSWARKGDGREKTSSLSHKNGKRRKDGKKRRARKK